jgi:hypothetical protein
MSVSFKPRFLAKQTSLIFRSLAFDKLSFEANPPSRATFQRIPAVDLFLAIQHLFNQIRVGRIAFKDHAIQDQVGSAAGQADFMTVVGIPAVFDDNVGVFFKIETTFWSAGTLSPWMTRRKVWS